MKACKENTFILIIAGIAFVALLLNSSNRKMFDPMSTTGQQQKYSIPSPAKEHGGNEQFADVSGLKTTTYGMTVPKQDDPTQLLPKDSNSQWASQNPSGEGVLSNISLLSAGHLIGQNTVGTSMRNSNLQERPDPVIARKEVGPWSMSTIDHTDSQKNVQ